MQKPKRRTYFIDLNGAAARGNLKILMLLYPFWGLMLPIFESSPSFEYGYSYHPILHLILVAVFLIAAAFSIMIGSNRLMITGKIIRFGHNIFGGYKTGDLKSLSLERSPLSKDMTLLRFNFDSEGKKHETIETAGMESRMKARLLTAVDNLAAGCAVPKSVRALPTSVPKAEIERSGDSSTLVYHSRLLLLQLKDSVASYQQLFWRIWAISFAALTVYLGPMIVYVLHLKIRTHIFHESGLDTSGGDFATPWFNCWRFLEPVAQRTSDAGNMIGTYAGDTGRALTMCLVACVALAWLLVYMHRPNRLTISPEGLTLKLVYFGVVISSESIRWDSLAVLELEKGSSPTDWNIVLRGKVPGDVRKLKLGALGGSAQKMELVRAIEKYCADIPVQPELLTALAPPTENSYTELWLASLAGAPQRERLTPLSEGHVLKDGAYTIEKKHGAGGQGVTYLARQRSTAGGEGEEGGEGGEAELVIKETILPVYVDSEHRRQSVENFERDARLLTRLDHPSLVKLRDYFIEDHRAYLVLERIHGQNLRQLIESNGPLKPSVVHNLAQQMCVILTYIHGQDPEVIHRDFTPENLMLDLSDGLKLIDFGVAHEFKNRTTATVVGKHAYLPPEQLRGKPSTQSDLYAMAATLYFLLTGEDPVPLTRLNPFEQVLAMGQAADGNYSDNDAERKYLALLSRAIESASELKTADRAASAAALLDMLDPGSVIKMSARDVEKLREMGAIKNLETIDG